MKCKCKYVHPEVRQIKMYWSWEIYASNLYHTIITHKCNVDNTITSSKYNESATLSERLELKIGIKIN